MGVDNRENTELVAQCQLVMNKIHRPNIIGTDGFLATGQFSAAINSRIHITQHLARCMVYDLEYIFNKFH